MSSVAGDWIKMRHSLKTAPEVVRIASALKADRLRTVGALYVLWCIADNHATDDGELHNYTCDAIDEEVGWVGFADAVCDAGWLECSSNSIIFPNFSRNNGKSAKRRALDADRKRGVRNVSASETDKKRTREEKRREEKIKEKSPPVVPPGDKPNRKRKTSMNPEWEPDQWNLEWAQENGFSDLEVEEQLPQFRDHWLGKGETRQDWQATWRTWMRNSRKFGGSNGTRESAEQAKQRRTVEAANRVLGNSGDETGGRLPGGTE